MKLIPKAKPVKIRIKSGGEEHSSLDSLKRNFNISDIQPLLDGRLVRWLKQQGENELANVISEIESASLNTLQGVMNVMQLFFKDYMEANGINNLLDLNKHWLNSAHYRKNGENLFFHITCNFGSTPESLEIIKYLYKHKEELKTPPCDWYKTFNLRVNEENESESDPEVLYILGKMLWESNQLNDLYSDHHHEDPDGLELIEKAARLGCQEANLFVFEYNRNDNRRFAGVNREKIRKWINNKWETTDNLKFSSEDYANEKERTILNFVCQCHALSKYSKYGTIVFNPCAGALDLPRNPLFHNSTSQHLSNLALSYFFPENTKQLNSILEKEKWFIIGLINKLEGYSKKATDAFVKADSYPPAQYMLSDKKLIGNSDLKQMTFPSQVTYVVKYLFDYE